MARYRGPPGSIILILADAISVFALFVIIVFAFVIFANFYVVVSGGIRE